MAPFRKSLSAFLVGLSLSQAAWPLGFGELELQSALNQPLQAEIPILGVPAYASDSIRVRLGKREDFASLGYDYLPEIDDIRTEIQQRDNRLVLLLRSRTALREPLLNLVLVAEEANTRYLRDYALLLDLPDSSRSRSAGNVSDAGTTATTVPTAVSNTAPAAPVASTPTLTPASVAVAPAAAEPTGNVALPSNATQANNATQAKNATQASLSPSQTRYGPTQPGDSLSKIAYRLGKASGVEWQAYGVALYQANPDAFIAGDPNRIKAAVALQLPTASDVQRYQRSDWNALFAGTSVGAGVEVSTRTSAAQPTAVAAPIIAATTATAPIATTPTITTPTATAPSAQDSALLQRLQQQNSELKAELSAATARMQALETQLAQLDSRYAELTQNNASVVAPTEPNAVADITPVADAAPATAASPVTEISPVTEAAPVTVQIRDTLAQTSAEAIAAEQSPIQTPSKPSTWQLVMWPLATVLALIIAGALFWQWRERRTQRKALQPRVKTTRVPKPVLPSAEVDESTVPQVDVGSPDRRMLKIKQVQSALETYLAYQRFDRALELLEHEMHIAGDDLVLRRQLQRLQKDVRKAQTEWQETHKEQMSELFDRATTTHVEKPVARDDGKKTSG